MLSRADPSRAKKERVREDKDETKEKDSIKLITLPEMEVGEIEKARKISEMVEASESELLVERRMWDERFNRARLTFIDNFMPESLRIRSNPYNYLKYMNEKIR